VHPDLVYRCTDCDRRRAAAAMDDLGDLTGFLREHERCTGDVVVDRVVVLPSDVASGLVDGDPLVHAAASFLALCSGAVLMSRGGSLFVPGAAESCPACSALLERVRV
jgi:hypothetical protein